MTAASKPFVLAEGGGLAAGDHATRRGAPRARSSHAESIRDISALTWRTLRRTLQDAALGMALSEPLVHAAYLTNLSPLALDEP